MNSGINIPCAEGLDRIREKPGKTAERWPPSSWSGLCEQAAASPPMGWPLWRGHSVTPSFLMD